MVNRGFVPSIAVLVCLLLGNPAGAQVNALDLFGGLIGAAQSQSAREAWARLPEAERSCLQRVLAQQNVAVPALVQNGVGPEDARLSAFTAQCRRFSPAVLRRNFPCVVPGEDGRPVTTRCDQAFAYRDANGRSLNVEPAEAARLSLSGTQIFTTEAETAEARQNRLQAGERRIRIERLRTVRASIDEYQRHAAPAVRAEAAQLRAQIDEQLSGRFEPSAETTDALERRAADLPALAERETARLAALERLRSLRAQAEARGRNGLPDPLVARLAALRAEAAALSKEPKTENRPERVGAVRDIGPSFKCDEANTALPMLICAEPGLRRLDLEMARAYYALRQVAPNDGASLRAEAVGLYKQTLEACRLPETGKPSAALRAKAPPCIARVYARQKDLWTDRVGREGGPDARQELARAIDEHVRLQQTLQDEGYLAGPGPADGVYGSVTRSAILAFANAEGVPSGGFMSDVVAERLRGRSRTPANRGLAVRAADQIDALSSRYEAVLADMALAETRRTANEQARGRLQALHRRIETLLGFLLPEDLRRTLTDLAPKADRTGTADLQAELDILERRLQALEPRLSAIETFQASLGEAGRRVLAGDPSDIVVFYNSAPGDHAVTRRLDGALTFAAGRTVGCTLGDFPTDRLSLRLLRAKVTALGAPMAERPAPCTAAERTGADLFFVERRALNDLTLSRAVAAAADAGSYSVATFVAGADREAARQQEAAALDEVRRAVAQGAPGGFAMLAFDNGSRAICRIELVDQVLNAQVLSIFVETLGDELPKAALGLSANPGDLFVATKQRRCGSIFASTGDVAILAEGFRRDQVRYRLLPLWVSPERVEAVRQAQAAAVQKIEAILADPDGQGIGAVAVSSAAHRMCRRGEVAPAVQAEIADVVAGIVGDASARADPLVAGDDDTILTAVRKGECGFVSGSGAALRPLLADMKRAALDYRILPIWFSPDDPKADRSPAPGIPSPFQLQPQIRPANPTPDTPAVLLPPETRVALIIANGSYEAVNQLDNPARDAVAVADTLRAIGFREVRLETNLGVDAMRRALSEFSTLAEHADWALIYYAGHGIEVAGTNYLVPVDARLKSDSAVSLEAISLDQAFGSIERARKFRIVILDACRDNPFLVTMARTLASRSVGRGLARVEPPGSTLVAYSAKAGQVALDGVVGQQNSPFSAALIEEVRKPNVEIRKLFGRVRDSVLKSTNNAQEPTTYGSIGGDDYVINPQAEGRFMLNAK